jgi:hypothetical protein
MNENEGRPYVHLFHSLMELSPSWEAANCAATQELPSILWTKTVFYFILPNDKLKFVIISKARKQPYLRGWSWKSRIMTVGHISLGHVTPK